MPYGARSDAIDAKILDFAASVSCVARGAFVLTFPFVPCMYYCDDTLYLTHTCTSLLDPRCMGQ